MNKIIIKATQLKKTYTLTKSNKVEALRGIDMEVHEGDFTAIVGPSGCGKSTLLHMLGLLDSPDEGTLIIDGIDTSKMKEHEAHQIRANKIGFVFQGFNLIPALTALENVMLAGKYGGMKSTDRKKRGQELLDMMGLNDRGHHRPNELSGGQQQRVALARALMNNPSIILADEPTGELDSTTSLEIINTLKKLNQEHNQTFVIVTHNDEVAKACKAILHVKDGRNA